ncbi:hypothetical protein BDQ17DRAFT_1433705 [Cyathus striatus]|nr:hypothetical protein BDQ17DRAFT_1433705 [Cyathus striatus]
MIATSLLFLLSLPLFGNSAAVTTVTLLEVAPTTTSGIPAAVSFPEPTYTFSAVGVGSDGLTTYVQEYHYSQAYDIGGVPTGTTTLSNGDVETQFYITTETVTFPVETVYATFAEGASEYKYVIEYSGTGSPFKDENHCHWDKDGKGECEEKLFYPGEATETYTETYSGTVGPLYTLVVSDIPGQATSSSSSTSYAARQAVIGVSTSVALLMTTAFFVLSGCI